MNSITTSILLAAACGAIAACGGGGGGDGEQPPVGSVTVEAHRDSVAFIAPDHLFVAHMVGLASYTNGTNELLDIEALARSRRVLHSYGPNPINVVDLLGFNRDAAGWTGGPSWTSARQAPPGGDARWYDCVVARTTLLPGSTLQAGLIAQLAALEVAQRGRLTSTDVEVSITARHHGEDRPDSSETCHG